MRQRAARDIDVADVEEALDRMDARAVEVWVAAQGTPLELSGDELVRLADAGVPESVIDVMVAVSYPDHFALTPEGAPQELERTAEYRGYRTYLFDPYYSGYAWRPYYYSPFGYSPFGFYRYGFGYGGYWGYVPATVIVRPVPDGDAVPGRGRMVPGRGYTRRDPQSGQPRPSAGVSPAPRRESSSAGPSRRSGGDSGGSRSSTPPRRTAQPR
ncbi:MAG TPA: hypothetical protein VFQ22_11675, partial [Longimicrobiales bacterium]|nr:hypothetical protein [Longimicrobiales bacterium]